MPTVKLFGNLRKHADASSLQVPGASVRAVLEALCEQRASLCEALLEEGQIRPHIKITLNGHDIQLVGGWDLPVGKEDRIAIFSPIAGG